MRLHADLHIHTTESDGELTIDELSDVAKQEGLSAVAVTDHDAIHPKLNSPIQTIDGVEVIRGIELRVSPEQLDERVDLLGYGVTQTAALESEIERLQGDRMGRARLMARRASTLLGAELNVDFSSGVGRPHIARAIAKHPDTEHTYESAFEEVIHRGGEVYEPRDVTSFERGVELLTEACELVVLAHPFRYDNPEDALELTHELDGVEKNYPYDTEVDMELLDDAVSAGDLVVTGGSDAHEKELAKAGVTEEQYDHISSILSQ